jgi:hypothetical protein
VLSPLLNIGLCCEYMAARSGFDAGPRRLALNYPASHRSPEIMSWAATHSCSVLP